MLHPSFSICIELLIMQRKVKQRKAEEKLITSAIKKDVHHVAAVVREQLPTNLLALVSARAASARATAKMWENLKKSIEEVCPSACR
jgi:uncharacterized DUF497 family protein